MPCTCALARTLAVITFAGLLSSTAATAGGPGGSGGAGGARPVATTPLPPHSTHKGLTYGEWMAAWWQAAFATEAEDERHPLLTGGAFGGTNGVVFLSAPVLSAGSPRVTIPVTIRHGTHLLVPIITVDCSVAEDEPFHGENEAELRACANGLLNLASDLHATIDGRRVENPFAWRVESPLFRYGPLVEGNFLKLPPATQSDAVGAGYFLLLPPLSAGRHRITVRANVAAAGLAADAEFIILVMPRGW